MRVVNLLNKDVTVVMDNGKTIQLKKTITMISLRLIKEALGYLSHYRLPRTGKFLCTMRRRARVLNLPDEEDKVFYLVDREIARASRRSDLCYLGDKVKRKGKSIGHQGIVFL